MRKDKARLDKTRQDKTNKIASDKINWDDHRVKYLFSASFLKSWNLLKAVSYPRVYDLPFENMT